MDAKSKKIELPVEFPDLAVERIIKQTRGTAELLYFCTVGDMSEDAVPDVAGVIMEKADELHEMFFGEEKVAG